jgi:hypothetical protein
VLVWDTKSKLPFIAQFKYVSPSEAHKYELVTETHKGKSKDVPKDAPKDVPKDVPKETTKPKHEPLPELVRKKKKKRT